MYGIPPQIWKALDQTTEKTIEINFLSEIANSLSPHFIVTILGPNIRQEKVLGFDDIIAGLPPGFTFAFQFKKPFLGMDGHPRFTLNVAQLQVLLNRFAQREAFFVLVPFTRTRDFVTAHRSGNFLPQSTLIDVFDIPFGRKQTQNTRTIKFLSPGQIQITDPRTYVEVEKTLSFKDIISSVTEERIGRKGPVEKERGIRSEEVRRYGGPNFYIHVSRRSPTHYGGKVEVLLH